MALLRSNLEGLPFTHDREIIVRRTIHQAMAGTMRPGHRPRAQPTETT
jgi:hypothetical protein